VEQKELQQNLPNKEYQPLSLLDILTRNLLLLTVIFLSVGFGIAVQLLDKHSLDCYFLQLQSDRLGFIFFIVVAACYISLLFIAINKQWVNFFVQIIVAIILFILLIFIFNPNLRVDIYLNKHHSSFNTRSWDKVEQLPITQLISFQWLQMPDKTDAFFPIGIVCPAKHSFYLLNFVFSHHYKLPLKKYQQNKLATGIGCNKASLKLLKQIPSREKTLLTADYKGFLELDKNMDGKRISERPLTIPIYALPIELQNQLAKYAELKQLPYDQQIVTPIILRQLLEKNKMIMKEKK